MADLPIPGSITPPPNVKIHKLWCESQIAELECSIKRLEADAQEIIQAKLKKIEADVEGKKRKIVALRARLDQLEQFGLQEVIELNGTEIKRLGGPNG
jgi:predicted  nucleic acid-binding Zn-ribbon protein